MMSTIVNLILVLGITWTGSQAQVGHMLPLLELRADDYIIDPGASSTLTCETTNATSEITWKRNGVPVVENAARNQLIIDDFSEANAGNYTCVVSNSRGTVSSAPAAIDLRAQNAEFFSSSLDSPHQVTVTRGHPIAISCGNYTSTPQIDLSWSYSFFGQFVAANLNSERAIVAANQSLVIVDPGVDQIGIFRCTLNNRIRQDHGYIQVLFQDSDVVVPLSVVIPPQDILTPRGKSVFFECIPGGDGAHEQIVTWTYPNDYDTNVRRIGRSAFKILISNVVDDNIGTYTCSTGAVSASARLDILELPEISPGLPSEQVQVTYAGPLQLSCPVTPVQPQAPIRWEWYHNGNRLAETSSALSFSSTTLDHSGTYQCFVYNAAGHSSSVTRVQVNTIPASISEDLLSNQLVFRDRPFTMSCSASGAPPPLYTWFKSTTPLETGTAFQVDSQVGQLTINNVERSSGGRYMCRATNSLPGVGEIGTANTVTNLITIRPTVIRAETGTVFSVQVATTTMLVCDVTHDEIATVTYSWTKDGAPISSSRVGLVDASTNGNLFITSVEFEDAGIYQCSVRTFSSDLEAPPVHSLPTSLEITETPVAPVILTLNSTSPNSFLIQWIFSGTPTFISNYTIESQPFQESPESPWTPLQTRSVNAITTADIRSEALEPFTEYRVRVVATYMDGVKVPSQAMVTRTGEREPADVPGAFAGTPFANNTGLLLSWTPPTMPRGVIIDYIIEYKLQSNDEYALENVGSDATSYHIFGLQELKLYEVRIAGVTSAGQGEFSPVITVWTASGMIEEPKSGPFVTTIGFIVLIVAVLVVAIVISVVVIMVVKRKAVQKKKARNYAIRHSGYFGKDNVIDMDCPDAQLSDTAMASYSSGRKRAFSSNSPPVSRLDVMERESSLGGGTEYTITGTPQLSVGSSTRLISNHMHGAPSYIDPPSFEQTVIKARSRSQSAASASYGMEIENTVSMTGTDWDTEQGSKMDFPINGINGMPTDVADYIYDDSDNSIEKVPVSEDTLSDHTEYSHLASMSTAGGPVTPTTVTTTISTSPGQGEMSFFHHHLNLPMSANSTESRSTPISFGEMIHNRLSAQSEDEVNAALNYATYV